MTKQERILLSQKPIIWKGDLSDDCTALWAGLMLRAESMNGKYWWWCVYDMTRNEVIIDDSNNYKERFIGGELTREKAMSIAHNYINDIISFEKTATFLISDCFKLTNRGTVLLGKITEGSIYSRDIIEFVYSHQVFYKEIKNIDVVRKLDQRTNYFGILIEWENELEIKELRETNPKSELLIHRKIQK